jgi:hypothetical protein
VVAYLGICLVFTLKSVRELIFTAHRVSSQKTNA